MISPPQDESRLFGVLVTFRRPDILRTTLNLLGEQTRSIDHLIVVDNAPTEQTRDVVAQYSSVHGSTEWLPMSDNLGPAGGVAAGVQRVLDLADERDWVLILDDDDPPRSETIIERLFSLAREALDADPTTGGFGLSGGRFDPKRGRIRPLPDVSLSGLIKVDVIANGVLPFYRVAMIGIVGTYRPELFFGLEEMDYGLRVTRAGFHLWVDGATARAPGWQAPEWRNKRSTIVPQGPPWRHYYSVRNRIAILRRNGLWRAAIFVTVSQLVRLALLPLRRPEKGTISLHARGVLDGWVGRSGRTVEPEDKSPE